MATIYNHTTYFQNIADNLLLIKNSGDGKHFTRISNIQQLEGFIAEAQYLKGYQLIVFDAERGQFVDNRSDNILVQRFHHFMVMAHVSSLLSDKDALANCKLIAEKCISKMLKDRKEYANCMEMLIVNSITYEQVGPLGSGWFGLDYSFRMQDFRPPNTVFNADDWELEVIS